MIDHILCYSDAAERPGGEGPCWLDGAGRTVMPVACVVVDAAYDAEGAEEAPAILAAGSWLVVRALARQADIEADPRCLVVADSERAERGEPFVLLSRLRPETPLGRVTPVFVGDAYPFPRGVAADLEPLMAG